MFLPAILTFSSLGTLNVVPFTISSYAPTKTASEFSPQSSPGLTVECRNAGVGQFQITFAGASRVNIRLENGPLLITDATSPALVQVPNWHHQLHPIFRVEAPRLPAVAVASREIRLAGAANFRDLGGYPASGGKRVVWGQLYRAGSIAQLSDTGHRQLDSLGVRLVCDLRSKFARDQQLLDWRTYSVPPSKPVVVVSPPSDADTSIQPDKISLSRSAAESELAMIEVYRQIPNESKQAFRAYFDALKTAKTPAITFCTAGKDCTGVLSAFVLLVLGVDREIVMEDYLLSNRYFYDETSARTMAKSLTTKWNLPSGQAGDILRPVLRVEPAYLAAALETVDQAPGGWTEYRRKVLGVSDRDQAALRKRLLE